MIIITHFVVCCYRFFLVPKKNNNSIWIGLRFGHIKNNVDDGNDDGDGNGDDKFYSFNSYLLNR